MKELIKDRLYSFDEKVRVELGPQIIELDCTDENLTDEVTCPHYKIGGRDAFGKLIRPDEMGGSLLTNRDTVMGVVNEGEKMNCVDWNAKHKPHVWKIYQLQEDVEGAVINGVTTGDTNPKTVWRFIQVDEDEQKQMALDIAQTIYEGMQ